MTQRLAYAVIRRGAAAVLPDGETSSFGPISHRNAYFNPNIYRNPHMDGDGTAELGARTPEPNYTQMLSKSKKWKKSVVKRFTRRSCWGY